MSPRSTVAWLLGTILIASLCLRLWGIGFGLPNTNCRPDETMIVAKSMAMGTGDLNPHFFNYPSFWFYVLAGVYGAYFVFARLTGLVGGVGDFQLRFFTDPTHFYLIPRVIVAVLGAASVLLVYWIGRELSRVPRGDGPDDVAQKTGLLAAAFLAPAFLHVRDSHYLTLDVPFTFLVLLSFLLLARFLRRGPDDLRPEKLLPASLAGASLLLGLATSTKYTAALFGLVPLAAPWVAPALLSESSARKLRFSAMVLLLMGVAFVAGSPFILLDAGSFLRDISLQAVEYTVGADVDLPPGWIHHLAFTFPHGIGWPLFVTALGGLLFLAFRRRPLDLLLLLAVLSFYAVGSLGNSAFFRYMLPLVPFLCLAAAALLVRLFGTRPGWQVGLLAVLLLSSTLVSSIRFDTLIAQTDTRLQAADWISRNVPSGSGIALEGMHFGYPRLFTARRWLEDELADFRAAGKDGRRLERMLALKTYPPEPNYYVVEMRPEEFFPRRVICESCTLEKLREKEVGWVVLQDHPVARPLPDPAFREALEREAVLVASFDPARKKEGHAEYDLIDAFYAPLAGFEAVERSGPRLRIYRLD